VTLYSYAFFAVGVLIATTGGSAAIVMAAPVAQGWDEDPRTLEPAILDVLRAGLTLVLPALALAALVGDDVILLLLGGVLDRADAVTIVTCILLFGPAIAEHLAGTVPGLAALARQRYGALAAIALVGIVLHAGLAAGAAATGRLEALVVAQVVAQTLMLAALLRLVHGRDAARVARLTGAEAVRYGAAGAVAWVPAGLLAGLVGGVAEQVAAFLLGCVLFAALLRLQPTRWEVARRMAGPAVALVGARRRASLAASR
jgi:hypothetical protein